MPISKKIVQADVVIFGGGCAGLWLLDDLRRRGLRVLLLESGRLGGGQTTGSQGILHGGVKYLLKGIFSASASSVRDMPEIWNASLSGGSEPDLSRMRIRSHSCYLWRSDSWQSWAGLIGARTMLEVKPIPLPHEERPAILAACPGQVFRLDEQVIDTVSFTEILAERNRELTLQIEAERLPQFQTTSEHHVDGINIPIADTDRELTLRPRHLVLAAGAGNQRLREALGLPGKAMQLRPLHMVLLRGDLPRLNGHCVDGAKTRVTITSDVDSASRVIWQVGGQLAEDGVELESSALIERAISELMAVLPGWTPESVEFTTYRIDRAEARTPDGSRPDDVQLLREGNVLTVWPTKLVLAPRMSERVIEQLGTFETEKTTSFRESIRELNWPAPPIALPPWELPATWIRGT